MKRLTTNSYIFLTVSMLIFTLVGDAIAEQPRDHHDAQFKVRDHRSCIVRLLSPRNYAVLTQRRIGGGRVESSWYFSWSECPGATGYNLYVIGPTALNPVVDINTFGTSYQHRSTHYGVTSLEGWTWKVRAYAYGEWGRWSETRTFDVRDAVRPTPTPRYNAIFNFRALDRSDKELEVAVDYAFDGRHPEAEPLFRSYMSAEALQRDGTQVPRTHFEGFGRPGYLNVGSGTSRMLINKFNDIPYRSVTIRICMNTQGRSGRLVQVLCENFRHTKVWR